MKRYRIEFYNSDFSVLDIQPILDKSVVHDYIVNGNTTVVVPLGAIVARGAYAVIREHGHEPLYCGIVTTYTSDDQKTEVTLQSFMTLLNVKIYMNPATLASMYIEDWLESYIKEYFYGSDSYMKVQGLTIVKKQKTKYDANKAAFTESDSNIYTLSDIIVGMFNIYGIVLDISIDAQAKKFIMTFRKVDTSSVYIIETDVADVISYNINLANQSDKFNKIVYLNSDYYSPKEDTDVSGLTQRVTYYWHPQGFEGYVDTDANTNREVPVRMTTKTAKAIEERKDKDGNVTTPASSFEAEAKADAYKTMYRDRYSDQIEIVTKLDSMLIMIGDIGQLYRIMCDGITYNSVLTAVEYVGDTAVRLTFGVARVRLTQVIKLMRKEIQNNGSN